MHHTDARRQILTICTRMNAISEALYGVAELSCNRDFDTKTTAWVMRSSARDFLDLSQELTSAMEQLTADPTPDPQET